MAVLVTYHSKEISRKEKFQDRSVQVDDRYMCTCNMHQDKTSFYVLFKVNLKYQPRLEYSDQVTFSRRALRDAFPVPL
jgi:hypothetical protein